MSRVERGLQAMDVVRHPRWNAQSSLNCPDTALSRPSRAMMRNTKPVSEASIQNVNPRYETAEGLVRDLIVSDPISESEMGSDAPSGVGERNST